MIYVIFGPTASGKTSVAIKIAHKLNAPIINADAFQVYREMNVGTAKLSKNDPDYKKHYLLDIISPSDTYSVKQYQEDFRHAINLLLQQNKDIVVVGGTGLYIKAAFYDYVFNDEKAMSYPDLEKLDDEHLYALLRELDYQASLTIHPHNRKRVLRAIIIAKNGENKSTNIANQNHQLVYSENEVRFLFLCPERDSLYQCINERVETMFVNDALVKETNMLLQKYVLSQTAKQAIGYKETIEFLQGNMTLEETKELIKKRTRNYAKRQITFFKNQFKSQVFLSKNEILEAFDIHD